MATLTKIGTLRSMAALALSLACAFSNAAARGNSVADSTAREETSSPAPGAALMPITETFEEAADKDANGLVVYAVPLPADFRTNIGTVTALKQVACRYTATTDIAKRIREINELLSSGVGRRASDPTTQGL